MPNPWLYAKDTDEHSHQVALFMWVACARFNGFEAANNFRSYDRPGWQGPKIPVKELELLYAIPNGGERNVIVAGKLKAEGVKPGVSDLHFPVSRHNYHGLYIEMKKPIGGRASKEQKEFAMLVREQGYACMIAMNWSIATEILETYLRGSTEAFNALPYWLGVE